MQTLPCLQEEIFISSACCVHFINNAAICILQEDDLGVLRKALLASMKDVSTFSLPPPPLPMHYLCKMIGGQWHLVWHRRFFVREIHKIWTFLWACWHVESNVLSIFLTLACSVATYICICFQGLAGVSRSTKSVSQNFSRLTLACFLG